MEIGALGEALVQYGALGIMVVYLWKDGEKRREEARIDREENRSAIGELVYKMERMTAYFAASQPPEVTEKVNQLIGQGND